MSDICLICGDTYPQNNLIICPACNELSKANECEDCGGQVALTAQPTCLTYTCEGCGVVYYDTNTDYKGELEIA